jgi:hypothetical protein
MAAPEEPGLLAKAWGTVTGAVSAVGQKVSDVSKKTFGDNAVTNGDKLTQSLALPQEAAGRTITGGRRYRKKTEKRRSKKRKTMRRKH